MKSWHTTVLIIMGILGVVLVGFVFCDQHSMEKKRKIDEENNMPFDEYDNWLLDEKYNYPLTGENNWSCSESPREQPPAYCKYTP